jgi:hypothetical protein
MSQGLAFEVPAAAADRDNMIRYQKLVEIFQHKGGSECLSTDDPDCAFEQLPDTTDPVRDRPGYVRSGLQKGLTLSPNPLKMGIVGATDDHNGTPGNVKESTFPGHTGSLDDTPQKRVRSEMATFNPGGITVAWAEENTRASIFAALQRRETYATSGPRMLVRFYQTSDATGACQDSQFPSVLVGRGAVPMGGSFKGTPRFVVAAWRDAAPLARVDIIKAWIDASGTPREKVVQHTASPSFTCVTWLDEDPTPGPALYYARVLESPTPRWSAYDCVKAPVACADAGALKADLQERAWTSPIWREP